MMRLFKYGPSSYGKIGARPLIRTRKTARDYVQSGLVAMWDGIENAGWGTHDASATTWVDLIGNSPAMTTSAASDAWEWTDNSLWTKAIAFSSNITNTDYVNALRTTYTVEYVGTIVSMVVTKYAWMMHSWASGYQRYGGLGTTYGDKLAIYCNGAANGAGLTSTGVPFHADDKIQTSYIYRMTEGGCDFYKDAAYIATATSGNIVDPVSMIPAISVGGVSNDKAQSAKTHSIRIYSRALTADEIAANCKIDKLRFNLP